MGAVSDGADVDDVHRGLAFVPPVDLEVHDFSGAERESVASGPFDGDLGREEVAALHIFVGLLIGVEGLVEHVALYCEPCAVLPEDFLWMGGET